MSELRTYVKIDEKNKVTELQQLYYTDEYPHEVPENMVDISDALIEFTTESITNVYLDSFNGKERLYFNPKNRKLRLICDVDFEKWVELVSD